MRKIDEENRPSIWMQNRVHSGDDNALKLQNVICRYNKVMLKSAELFSNHLPLNMQPYEYNWGTKTKHVS